MQLDKNQTSSVVLDMVWTHHSAKFVIRMKTPATQFPSCIGYSNIPIWSHSLRKKNGRYGMETMVDNR